MDSLSVKIPELIRKKLNTFSKRKGLSKSEIVRDALVEYFEKNETANESSFYDLSSDIAGSVEDKPDLSSNKEYLSDYGK